MCTLLGLVLAPYALAQMEFIEGYRFFYNLSPATDFSETSHSVQTGGGKLLSEFDQRVQFQVTQEPDDADSSVTARILSLSNQGRSIDYYDGVIFQTRFSVTGETGEFAFSGGMPKHRALLQAAGPAKAQDIFWIPAFPTTPMKVGDSFTQTRSTNQANGRTEYVLEEVEGNLARFHLRYSGTTAVAGGSGSESGEGLAVFDMDKGMWRSHSLDTQGTLTLPGLPATSYKSTSAKEISSNAGCDRVTTGVDNAQEMINQSRRLADDMLSSALSVWPLRGQDLYAVYRHFHCPTSSQISRIRDNLRHIRQILAGLDYSCIPKTADPCQQGNYGIFTGVDLSAPVTSRCPRLQLCPGLFHETPLRFAGVMIINGALCADVSTQQECRMSEPCYYNFMESAEDVVTGNNQAYAYLARELSGWRPPVQPQHVPCLPSVTADSIRVRGGETATDPAAVQNEEGDNYGILEDLVTGERFIRHNHLEGADHYLYQESRDGMDMRYYLPTRE